MDPLNDLMKLRIFSSERCISVQSIAYHLLGFTNLRSPRLRVWGEHYIEDLYCSPRKKSSYFPMIKCGKLLVIDFQFIA